jgi:Na+/H+ antiporter NhaC
VRAGLALLGLIHLSWGLPATLAPRWFFDTFPGFGHAWTAAYPPYNEHLIVDLGATFTTLGVLLLVAAWIADRRVTAVVLCGVLVFSSLHLIFHVRDHGALAGADLAASLVALALGVVAPVALLMLDRRRPA